MSGSVIVAGARTPIGRLLGGLKDLSAADLGGVAIKGALSKAGIAGDQVDYVIMGQVLQAGAGQITARQAAVKGGIPMTVPSITINKVCLSGINAIAMADQLIRAGEHEIVIAGGMESMTQAPHLLPKSREGFKYGDTTLVDSMAYDALFDQFTDQAMGGLTEACNAAGAGLTREEQDAFAAQSHQRAAMAWKNGVFDDEVVPVEIPQRRGEPVVVSQDEGVRGDTTGESLGKLRPAFSREGTITAGSAFLCSAMMTMFGPPTTFDGCCEGVFLSPRVIISRTCTSSTMPLRSTVRWRASTSRAGSPMSMAVALAADRSRASRARSSGTGRCRDDCHVDRKDRPGPPQGARYRCRPVTPATPGSARW